MFAITFVFLFFSSIFVILGLYFNKKATDERFNQQGSGSVNSGVSFMFINFFLLFAYLSLSSSMTYLQTASFPSVTAITSVQPTQSTYTSLQNYISYGMYILIIFALIYDFIFAITWGLYLFKRKNQSVFEK